MEEEKKSKVLRAKKNTDENEGGEGIDILRMALQQDELGQYYEAANDHFISNSQVKGQITLENIKKRDARNLGVQNVKVRALCIAAYLRCLYASIEYAPTQQLKQEAIMCLKDLFVFRNLTQLCDTTGWFEANIGAKYLRIMRHIIKVPYTESMESFENQPHYEIMSIAIRKMLNEVLIRIKNEQQRQLSNEEKILIYELAATCQMMSQQCSLFRWSAVEVKQAGSHARTRRTPQEKILDLHISMLFPTQSILTFIAIIFRDMMLSYKVFEGEGKGVAGDENENAFIKVKNNLARESIKGFLGHYLARCKDNKYEVLEALMKGVVFEKKKLRESYLQEILKAHSAASYQSSIE